MQAILNIIQGYLDFCFVVGAALISLIGVIGLYLVFLFLLDYALTKSLKTKRLFKVYLEVMYRVKGEKERDSKHNNR